MCFQILVLALFWLCLSNFDNSKIIMNISKISAKYAKKTHFIPLWNMYIVRWVQTSCNSPLLSWLIAEVRKFVCIICKTESRGSSLIFCRPFVNEATRAGSNVVGTLFHKNEINPRIPKSIFLLKPVWNYRLHLWLQHYEM